MAPVSANIAKLPPEVQAAIASLPYQDQEVFSYIALHDNSLSSSCSALPGTGSCKKKGRAKNSGADAAAPAPASKMSDHAPSFVCACFVCYMAYWSLYDASPNKVAMDDAFALNDSLSLAVAEVSSSSSSSSTTSSPGQRRSSSSSSSPWGKRRGERGKAKKKCSNKVSSPASLDVGYQHPSPTTPPPPLSEYQHHRFDDQEERKRGAGKKAKDDSGAGVPSKPRSKQVAPFDFKEEDEDEEVSPEPESARLEILEDPAANGPAASTTKPQSLGSRVSEAVCFVCETLLGMWYPRLRRRNPAENR